MFAMGCTPSSKLCALYVVSDNGGSAGKSAISGGIGNDGDAVPECDASLEGFLQYDEDTPISSTMSEEKALMEVPAAAGGTELD
mmetsp:Transcript_11767/g.17151  ORF Transcript_11767/g.17151 Transcript_11767/m.17151 type:complete len:84 (+) Transcript_11767:475-726(+)